MSKSIQCVIAQLSGNHLELLKDKTGAVLFQDFSGNVVL